MKKNEYEWREDGVENERLTPTNISMHSFPDWPDWPDRPDGLHSKERTEARARLRRAVGIWATEKEAPDAGNAASLRAAVLKSS
jgi:hypothetical protein